MKAKKINIFYNRSCLFSIYYVFICEMNFELESKWRKTIQKISKNFDDQLDIQAILFLIGLQELNIDIKKLTKDQKIEVIHVGLCTILSPYGYYNKVGVDNEGWPHFENVKKLPNVEQNQQEQIIKEAIIDYFD